MDLQDASSRARFLIRDRDGKYPALFDAILADTGIQVILTGVHMPRMNAIMERWIQTCRHELLDRTLICTSDICSTPCASTSGTTTLTARTAASTTLGPSIRYPHPSPTPANASTTPPQDYLAEAQRHTLFELRPA